MQLKAVAKHRPLVIFFLLAYGIAWLLWLPLILSRTGLGLLPLVIPMPYVVVGTFAPTLAAFLTQWLATNKGQFFFFTVNWKKAAAGLFAGLLLISIGFIILPSSLLTTSGWLGWQWSALGSYPSLIAHAIFFAAGPLGEEPGWRGYALPRLKNYYGSAKATLLLGVLWFGWHLPLFLIPSWTSSPMPVYALIVIGLCFIMTLGANLSGDNILVAIVLHAAFNASPQVVAAFLEKSQVRDSPSFELTIALCFLGIAVAIFFAFPKLDKLEGPIS